MAGNNRSSPSDWTYQHSFIGPKFQWCNPLSNTTSGNSMRWPCVYHHICQQNDRIWLKTNKHQYSLQYLMTKCNQRKQSLFDHNFTIINTVTHVHVTKTNDGTSLKWLNTTNIKLLILLLWNYELQYKVRYSSDTYSTINKFFSLKIIRNSFNWLNN